MKLRQPLQFAKRCQFQQEYVLIDEDKDYIQSSSSYEEVFLLQRSR